MTEEAANQAASEIPDSKADLMARIQQEWQALQATVAGATEADLLRPGPEVWSPKDHLAHLAVWLDILLKYYLDSQPFGEAAGIDLPTSGGPYTSDNLNAIFFERNKDLSLAQVRAWLDQAHADALARLQTVSFNDLMQVFDPHDPEARLLIQEVMDNTNQHYRGHNRIIRALLDRPL